jgi:cell division protein FtsA
MLAGIDIGSHKVCTLIGEALPRGGVRILGMGHAPAAGIRRGEIVHVEDAAGAIAASVERAERTSGLRVDQAVVGITGPHLAGVGNRAVVPVSRRPRPIESADVDRVLEAAGALPQPADREVLHVLPQAFTVDSTGPVFSPLGMEGVRLEADVHIVTAAAAALTHLRRCLELAELRSAALTMSTLAAAEATLTRDERELGVFVVDLGSACTGLACYRHGLLVHSGVVPIGGRHMTNDLAVVLQTPLAQAERIKITHGHVLPDLDKDPVEIPIKPFGEAVERTMSRRHASEVLAARADEIGRLVEAEVERAGLAGKLPAGAVLVGGTSELGGLARRLCTQWQLPVRLGRPQDVLGLGDAARGPAHAAAVGLLLWRIRDVQDARDLPIGQAVRPVPAGAGRLLAWVRQAFVPGGGQRGWRAADE